MGFPSSDISTVPIYVPVTKADADLPGGTCAAILVGVAGTLNLMQDNGTIRTAVPALAGVSPLRARQIRLGGTATDIWALYHS